MIQAIHKILVSSRPPNIEHHFNGFAPGHIPKIEKVNLPGNILLRSSISQPTQLPETSKGAFLYSAV
jgi:hypothetical protein